MQPTYGSYGTYIQSPTGMRTVSTPASAKATISFSVTHVRQCRRSCLFASSSPNAVQNDKESMPTCFGASSPHRSYAPKNW